MKLSLTAAMPVGEAMRCILAQQFDKLRALENAVRAPENVEAVHDMRVACRRMKSAFRFGRAYLPHKQVAQELELLDHLRETLGAVRNLDVLQTALRQFRAHASAHDVAALEGLAAAWSNARAEHQNALLRLLSSRAYADWAERMNAFLEHAAPQSGPRVADEIPARLWKQYGIVRAYETRLDGAPLSVFHALRIEVKRLRYALEFFSEALTAPKNLPPQPKELIEALVALQDLLGELQDAVVSGEFVTQYLIVKTERAQSAVSAADFHTLADYQKYLRAQVQTRRAQTPPFYAALVSPWFRDSLGVLTARL